MTNEQEYIDALKEIRSIMQRSTRFISLSGLSGIAAGIYALAGTYFAYRLLYENDGSISDGGLMHPGGQVIRPLVFIAASVLILTLATGTWLSYLKAKREGKVFWGQGSMQFLVGVSIPLLAGGIFAIMLMLQGYYGMIVPAFLVFYGLALVHGGRYTVTDIQWPGYVEIILGLVCAIFPENGLLFWALGFGLLHIIYGIIMSLKYGL
ncbi:MAG TPA: hypothetical protein VI583_06500 [Cyclobacteriaceae bacterium]|nr:hypothetical protein [Cyclobacteriaceae bacterium]